MIHRTSSRWTTKTLKGRNDFSTAVAVHYNEKDMNAPRVSVKGSNIIVKEMKAIAKRFGVPIHQSLELAKKLSELDVSSEIPQDLYEEVSKVFLSTQSGKF